MLAPRGIGVHAVLTGPTDRIPPARRGSLGEALQRAAQGLSLAA